MAVELQQAFAAAVVGAELQQTSAGGAAKLQQTLAAVVAAAGGAKLQQTFAPVAVVAAAELQQSFAAVAVVAAAAVAELQQTCAGGLLQASSSFLEAQPQTTKFVQSWEPFKPSLSRQRMPNEPIKGKHWNAKLQNSNGPWKVVNITMIFCFQKKQKITSRSICHQGTTLTPGIKAAGKLVVMVATGTEQPPWPPCPPAPAWTELSTLTNIHLVHTLHCICQATAVAADMGKGAISPVAPALLLAWQPATA